VSLHAADSVLLIEGLGQQAYGSLNWGDGLITDRDTIARSGLSDPNPFFQELLTKPYRRQVVAAVHVYPPAISKVGWAPCSSGVTSPPENVLKPANGINQAIIVAVCRRHKQ
jgi:hypothetical protein